jgi:hypothetical protein
MANHEIKRAQGVIMKLILKLSILIMSPYLLFVYWRESMKEIGDLHAGQEYNWNE